MENPATSPTKICPTCGTRISQDAARCLVCGTNFKENMTASTKGNSSITTEATEIRGSRMPELTLSVPVILIMLFIFIMIGGGLTYFAINATGGIANTTETPTVTATLAPSTTPTPLAPTATITPQATFTPSSYLVQEQDTCAGVAFAFDVSVQSIILANGLPASCNLFIGQELKIPHPTSTPTPLATNTPSNAQAKIEACETFLHVVQENETMSLIEASYEVPSVEIIEWNGKTTDSVFLGERLFIPLCKRTFVRGATVTPSPAPPYPAPELLLPRNGEAYFLDNDTVTLQWSSVGELRDNEFYQVTIIDITSGENLKLVDVVRDTKYIVPETFRPSESNPHVFQWSVLSVTQRGTDEDGNATFESGGGISEFNYFTWSGSAIDATESP
ncbi:MAG: LysM peptidoglycan-binding domain-containing protein [Chloroflexota bacterium]